MKKLLNTIIVIFVCIPINITMASTQDYYYTNYNGIHMTKDQYENLKKIYNEEMIDTLSEEEFTKYANSNIDIISSFDDLNNGAIQSNRASGYCSAWPYGQTGCWETSSKRLGIALISINNDNVNLEIHVENAWLNMPSVKKFDLLAAYFPNTSMFTMTGISGKQSCKNSNNESVIVNYSRGGTNTKEVSNGAAIAMNIVDECTKNLNNKMIINVKATGANGTFYYYGAYQHGITNTTLADAHNFNFAFGGNSGVIVGGMLLMPTSVAAKFDQMNGVYMTYTQK